MRYVNSDEDTFKKEASFHPWCWLEIVHQSILQSDDDIRYLLWIAH